MPIKIIVKVWKESQTGKKYFLNYDHKNWYTIFIILSTRLDGIFLNCVN